MLRTLKPFLVNTEDMLQGMLLVGVHYLQHGTAMGRDLVSLRCLLAVVHGECSRRAVEVGSMRDEELIF